MKYILLILMFVTQTAFAGVDLVKVDKSERKMYLLSAGEIVKVYDIALGANPKGHKEQEGDEKKPEGEYTLDYKKEDSSFYRAMHVSYPNAVDTANAEKNGVSPGGFIMVHGQRNWLGPVNTNKCVCNQSKLDEKFKDHIQFVKA